jgi:hypothetical protein
MVSGPTTAGMIVLSVMQEDSRLKSGTSRAACTGKHSPRHDCNQNQYQFAHLHSLRKLDFGIVQSCEGHSSSLSAPLAFGAARFVDANRVDREAFIFSEVPIIIPEVSAFLGSKEQFELIQWLYTRCS